MADRYKTPKGRHLNVVRREDDKNIVVEKVVYYYPEYHRNKKFRGKKTTFSSHKTLEVNVLLSETKIDRDTGRHTVKYFISKRHKLGAKKRKKQTSIKFFEKRMVKSIHKRKVTVVLSERARDGALVITYPGKKRR